MSFETVKVPSGHQSAVTVSQVVTDVDLVSRSSLLEATLASGRYTEFCNKKLSQCKDQTEAAIWNFLKVCLPLNNNNNNTKFIMRT